MSSEVRTHVAVAILLATLSSGAFAAESADAAAIRAQIEALRAEQARIAEMQRQTEAKIRALAARVGATSPAAQTAPEVAPTAPAPLVADGESKLNVSGDLRLRGSTSASSVCMAARFRSLSHAPIWCGTAM